LKLFITSDLPDKHQVFAAPSRTKFLAESARIQIGLEGEVRELELSGASRRVLTSSRRAEPDAIKTGLIDSDVEITVKRISAFYRDFLSRTRQLRFLQLSVVFQFSFISNRLRFYKSILVYFYVNVSFLNLFLKLKNLFIKIKIFKYLFPFIN